MDKIIGKRGLDGIYIVDELTGLQPDVWKKLLTVLVYNDYFRTTRGSDQE
jgi:hypothetical protein|nr:MAG TPA: hypothetical protein [Caudoviricetes sp.]